MMKGLTIILLSLFVVHILNVEARKKGAKRPRNTGCLLTGSKAYDRCGRRCDIVNGRLVNCCRVRRDFESMHFEDRRRFTDAYITISTKEPYKSEYVKLLKMHEKYFFAGIHSEKQFLPWHRWFILALENLLQKVDCRVTQPYWDWSIWSQDPWDLRKMWDPIYGLGGNGRKSDECVKTGPFRVGKWKTASGQCLRRGFNLNPPDADQVAITIRESDFSKFDLMLRVNLHEGMHCFINGTMCSGQSAEAPEFFFHHGFIDKIWNDFQKKGPNHKFAFFPSVKSKMTAIDFYPKDLVDNSKLPYGVRVCYDDPTTQSATRIRKFLNALSFKDLETLERLSFAKNPGKAKQLFRISQHDRSAAAALEKEAMQNVDSKRKSSIFAKTLSSLGRAEGFEVPPYCNVSPLRKAPVSRIDEREEEEIYYKDGLDDYFEDEDEDEESNESF